MKIIVVDDEEVMRDCICGYLKQKGHSCKVASSGKDALSQIQKEWTDVVVTDLKMPNMGGIELLKVLRNQYPEIKVIILSGFQTTKNISQAEDLGVYSFCSKTLDLLKFANLIDKIKVEMEGPK